MTEEKARPDTDNEQELGKDPVPKMGAGEDLPEGKVAKETEASITEQAEEEKLSPELEELMKKKGFKDLSEFAKAYEASEKKQTELEKDARLRSLTQVPERPKQEREIKPYPELTKEPYDMSKEEYEVFRKQEREAFKDELTGMYEDAEADKKWNREYRETMAVVNKDPERFEALKPTLATLHTKYPDAPLSEIYPLADEMEKSQNQRRKDEFIKETFGPNVDVDKLKTLVSKVRPAEIAGAGGAGAANVNKTGQQKAEEAIWDGIKESDKRRE